LASTPKYIEIRYCININIITFPAIWLDDKGSKGMAFKVKMRGSEIYKILTNINTYITFINTKNNLLDTLENRISLIIMYIMFKFKKCLTTDFDMHIAWLT